MGASGSSRNPDEAQPSGSSFPSESTARRRHILIVEDNAADVYLIQEAIRAAQLDVDLRVLKDGEQAISFFDQADREENTPCPSLMILDINLPRKHGGEVLRHMRNSRRCGQTLVIAISTSDSARDREEMARLGANIYFRKPSRHAEFMKLGDIARNLLNDAAGAGGG